MGPDGLGNRRNVRLLCERHREVFPGWANGTDVLLVLFVDVRVRGHFRVFSDGLLLAVDRGNLVALDSVRFEHRVTPSSRRAGETLHRR